MTSAAPISVQLLSRPGKPIEAQESREVLRYVHDGQIQLGVVYESGDGFEVALASGKLLGIFRSARLASSAISGSEREASCD